MRRPSEPMDSWWLCEQLLELSSMSENEEGFSCNAEHVPHSGNSAVRTSRCFDGCNEPVHGIVFAFFVKTFELHGQGCCRAGASERL